MSESDIICEWYCTVRCKDIKGAVQQYCFDVEPFNLTACYIMKYEVKCNDYVHQNGRPWKPLYNNVQALVIFFWACVSIDWREEFYMW